MNKTISKKNLIILGVILVAFPFVADKMFNWNYGVLLANFAILYIIAVSGLDILFGYSGQISMGHAAFYCIGAYGSVLIHQFTGLPVIVTILMGTVIATLIGALLAYPASKLVFHFLSLATIAFGEVVYQLVAQSPGNITGNFTGKFTDTISLFGFKLNSYTKYYYFSMICMVIFLVIKVNLVHSRVGRAFIAIRENSHAANGMGINVRKYKVIAFATSAFYTAFAGGLYAHLGALHQPGYLHQQAVRHVPDHAAVRRQRLCGRNRNRRVYGPVLKRDPALRRALPAAHLRHPSAAGNPGVPGRLIRADQASDRKDKIEEGGEGKCCKLIILP